MIRLLTASEQISCGTIFIVNRTEESVLGHDESTVARSGRTLLNDTHRGRREYRRRHRGIARKHPTRATVAWRTGNPPPQHCDKNKCTQEQWPITLHHVVSLEHLDE
jgi:hypothetical protein